MSHLEDPTTATPHHDLVRLGRARVNRWLSVLIVGLLMLPGTAPLLARKQRIEPPANPLALDADIARFLARRVPSNLEPEARLQALLDVLFAKNGLGITYGNQRTKTAIETFRTRSGNCLSFTFLFVAMARHVGLQAYFQEVAEVTSWDRRGELVVVHQHMYAEVEIRNGHVQVDFLPGAEKRYRRVHRIDDPRARAHFHNNLAVERLADGESEQAQELLRRALEQAPDFTPALANLGVSQRRQGDIEAAETTYLRALELAPNEPTVLSNLASLYLAQGRSGDAQPLLQRAEDHLRRNPYHHYRKGVVALQAGDATTAVRHLQQATRRLETDAELFSALAEAQAALGDLEGAEKSRTVARSLNGSDSNL